MHDYELMRSAAATGPTRLVDMAEALVLGAYARLLVQVGAPPRPSVTSSEPFDVYVRSFGSAAMKALEATTSPDFQLIAKAHVLGLAQGAGFPTLSAKEARSMYSEALRFGHALRQAETRCQAEGTAGTFVPLPLEVELQREELEAMWAQPSATEEDDGRPDAWTSSYSEVRRYVLARSRPIPVPGDAEAAETSLQEALHRLRRLGTTTKPALATYLDWLGKFDPEALALLSAPPPTVAAAMDLQVSAVFGDRDEKTSKDDFSTVSTTPSDMIEAVLFGAWLHDENMAAEETHSRYRQQCQEEEDDKEDAGSMESQ